MSRMKRVLWLASAVAFGVVVGLGSAMLMIRNGAMIGRVDNDQWQSSRTIGSTEADPYTRALIARIGLLGLNRNETIYFNRTRDEAGRPFDGRCRYRMEGVDPPARWWSITLYAPDSYLAINGRDRHALDATSVSRTADGSWSAAIGPAPSGAANWISSENAGTFSLTIRLYNPEASVADDMGTVALPRIIRAACPEVVS